MSKQPKSEPLGDRTQRPHAEDGWKAERDHTEPTGIQQDDNHGWPAGDPMRGRRA